MEARKEGGEEDARGRRWGKLCELDVQKKKGNSAPFIFFFSSSYFFLPDFPPPVPKFTALLSCPENTLANIGRGEGVL